MLYLWGNVQVIDSAIISPCVFFKVIHECVSCDHWPMDWDGNTIIVATHGRFQRSCFFLNIQGLSHTRASG